MCSNCFVTLYTFVYGLRGGPKQENSNPAVILLVHSERVRKSEFPLKRESQRSSAPPPPRRPGRGGGRLPGEWWGIRGGDAETGGAPRAHVTSTADDILPTRLAATHRQPTPVRTSVTTEALARRVCPGARRPVLPVSGKNLPKAPIAWVSGGRPFQGTRTRLGGKG